MRLNRKRFGQRFVTGAVCRRTTFWAAHSSVIIQQPFSTASERDTMAGMWQGIEGHDAVVEHFRRMLGANRLASTYLFVGPEGIGKRAFALKFAQTLLCTQNPPSEMNLCGQCESCRLALSGNHP